MRYDNWDVLLFPAGRDSKTPFKEFRVGCNIVPDAENAQSHGLAVMPVMTCCVPSLETGARFQLSVHSWTEPEISLATRRYGTRSDLVHFEARIFIDGILVASTLFGQKEVWPNLIDCKNETTRPGELAPLIFPRFKVESFKADSWHPGDEMGRIKVVISEVFPHDSVTVPRERITNIVAFSFQHAPLEVLERCGIAWPNRFIFSPPTAIKPLLPVPAYCPDSHTQSHAHSSRHRWFLRPPDSPFVLRNNMAVGSMQPPHNASLSNPWAPIDVAAVTRHPPAVFVPATLGGVAPFELCNPWGDVATNSQLGNHMGNSDGVSMWPPLRDPNRMSMSDDTATTNDMMAEFVSGLDKHDTSGGGEPMHISGPSLEDDPLPAANVDMQVMTTDSPSTMESAGGSLFVPLPRTTSTSNLTTGAAETSLSFSGDATASLILSSDSAESLPRAVLSQPLGVPPSRQTQTLPLVGSKVKAHKAYRFGTRHAPSNPGTPWSTQTIGFNDTRKLSLSRFNASPSTAFEAFTHDASLDSSTSSASVGTTFSSRFGSDSVIGAGALAVTGRTSLPLGDACLETLNSAGSGRGSSKKRHRDSTTGCLESDEANERSPFQPNPCVRLAAGTHDETE